MTTTIEWTNATWNPVVGCSRVSKGCEHCYAERVAHRGLSPSHKGLTVMGKHGPRWNGTVRFLPDRLAEPLRWRKPKRVFVNSMSDLFHEGVSDEQIAAVFAVMAESPQHTFQILTKRPERARAWFEKYDGSEVEGAASDAITKGWIAPPPGWVRESQSHAHASTGAYLGSEVWWERVESLPWPLPNVWLGVSVEDQATADERIPVLLDTPAAIRWVSYEPALGPVDFAPWLEGAPPIDGYPDVPEGMRGTAGLDWIVVGGESGPGARPFDLAWARSTIAQGRAAGVPVFVKQLGAQAIFVSSDRVRPVGLLDRKGGDPGEWPEGLLVREWPQEAA